MENVVRREIEFKVPKITLELRKKHLAGFINIFNEVLEFQFDFLNKEFFMQNFLNLFMKIIEEQTSL